MQRMNQNVKDKIFDVTNLIFVTLFFIVILYPLVFIVSASFSDPNLVSRGQVWLLPKGINIEGYKRIFQDSEIMLGYRNTIFYTVFGTLLNLFVTLTAAYALSKKDLSGRGLFMLFFLFTMYFNGGMIPTYLLIKSLNLINTWTVLILATAVNTFNLIISRTFFANGVPSDLEEAARIDGCSITKTFILIVLPLSKALIGVITLYYGVLHWNSWFQALIYLTGREKIPLQLVLREILIEQQMKAEMMMTDSMDDELLSLQVKIAALIKYCVIVVSSAPVIAVYPFIQKYFDKGVMLGSLKG
jgi:putative aldouronate transport system permease protein